jgi:hypothetical protein
MSLVGGEADGISTKADIGQRMSLVGGRPDVARRWSELLLLAEAVEEVGADRFCATIGLVG